MNNDAPSPQVGGHLAPLWLTESQAAERLNVSIKFLQKQRYLGDGPRFAKFGASVRYSIADIQEYERRSLR